MGVDSCEKRGSGCGMAITVMPMSHAYRLSLKSNGKTCGNARLFYIAGKVKVL